MKHFEKLCEALRLSPGGFFAPNRVGAALAAAHLSHRDRERDDRKGRPYAGGIFVYKNTGFLLTNVRVVWYNRCNRIQTVEAEITVYVDPTESPGG